MADVYSHRFYSVKGLAPGSSAAIAIDAGRTAVIRTVDCYCSAGASNAQLFIEGDQGQAFFRAEVVALTQDEAQWRGDQVLFENETLTINNPSASPWDVTISGYLLTNP